ncbi:hypothetical protein [Streptomyces sp. NPDC088725]|uniref:hypothetical protein n=1 Tax=Streptomyces sp. NPDC088725 TaxID=3365873 RepID=UPI00382FF8F9
MRERVAGFTSSLGPDGGYRDPTSQERKTVAEGVGLLLDGHRAEAAKRLADIDFRLRTLTDRVGGRRYAEIADNAETSRAARGWGRIYVDLDTAPQWSVQVPHPFSDRASDMVGVGVLRATPGGVLILAGAHREAGEGNESDMAHRRDSVFHAVCAELLKRRLPGIQVHGFANASAPGYDVIASTGAGGKGRTAGRALADGLREKGFTVCRAWARDCPLAGRENVQGVAAKAAGVPFLHVEFNRDVRTDEKLIGRVAAASKAATSAWGITPAPAAPASSPAARPAG